MRALILYAKLSPFHIARLSAAADAFVAQRAELQCVEIAEKQSEYGWPIQRPATARFRWSTLFQDRDYATLGWGAVWPAVRRALEERKPHVVVINGWGHAESWPALLFCAKRQIARVLISDSQHQDKGRWWPKETVKRFFVARCQTALVGGAPHARYLEKLGLPQRYVLPGCDVVNNEHFARDGVPEEPPGDGLRLVSSLRLVPQKNVVDTVRQLARLELPWQWTIAGEGPERPKIERTIRRLRVDQRVRLLGHVAYVDIAALLRAHDAYLQPSLSEPWGLAVNEAMASGLPVLVSRQCGCQEDLVREGENGFLFDARDPSDLARAVTRMWESRERWAEMGGASRRIIAPWSLELFANSLYRVCEMAIERLGKGNAP